MNIEVLWDGTSGLSSLSEKTRKSNRLQMSLQRQHFLLSYLKTLSVYTLTVHCIDKCNRPSDQNVVNVAMSAQCTLQKWMSC